MKRSILLIICMCCLGMLYGERDLANDYFMESRRYFAEGEYEKSLEYIEKYLKENPGDPMAYNNKGAALIQLKRYQEALPVLTHAMTVDPNNSHAFYNRGTAYNFLSQYGMALGDFDMAIALAPGISDYYHNRGNSYHFMTIYHEAITDYTMAIQLAPEFPNTYLSRAASYYKMHQYGKATEDCNKTIELKPDHGYAYFYLIIYSYLISRDTYKQARKQLKQNMHRLNNDAWQYELARLYTRFFAWARPIIKLAGTDKEKLCEAYFYIGFQCLRNNNKFRAKKFLRKAKDLNMPEYYTEYDLAVDFLK